MKEDPKIIDQINRMNKTPIQEKWINKFLDKTIILEIDEILDMNNK